MMKKVQIGLLLLLLFPVITVGAQGVSTLPGDVNGDGILDIIDALMVAQYYVGGNPPGFITSRADINNDGGITIIDALIIAQIYVGMIPAPTPVSGQTPTPQPLSIIYIAPNGSASAAGTITQPTTIGEAVKRIKPGESIQARGGTYNLTTTINITPGNNGYAGALKQLTSYPGEQAIFNFSAMSENASNRGFQMNGNYWHFRNIIVEGAGDNGIYIGGNNNIVERCILRKNRDTGLQISRIDSTYASISSWPSNNLILQCESYDNADSTNENADGFAAKLTCGTGNIFRGCISRNNIDDGWDLYTKTATGPIGAVTLEYCIAYNNGVLTNGTTSGTGDKNGFKLGGEDISVNHQVRYCIAYNNGKHGFTYNRNLGNILIENCAAANNTQRNFSFDGGISTFKNNLSYQSGMTDKLIGGSLNANYNCWWDTQKGTINPRGLKVAADDFLSLTLGSITFKADGSLDFQNFMKLATNSDLKGAGLGGANIGAR